MRQLRNTELPPEPISEFEPIPARHHQGGSVRLLVPTTTTDDIPGGRIILPRPVPHQEGLWHRRTCGYKLPLLHCIEAIHLGTEVALATIILDHIAAGCGGYNSTWLYDRSNSDNCAMRIATSGIQGVLLLSSRYVASHGAVLLERQYSPSPTSTASWSFAT